MQFVTKVRKFLIITISFLSTLNLSAQMLTGRILDTNEQAVPNATVYIRETAHGIMSDNNGEFQTKMDIGEYTLDISSLGYERKTMTVTILPEGLNLNIQLTEKVYTLREVVVTPRKEDLAYSIMRNVIARAPYHLRQVKSFESDVYLKGTLKIDKLPAIVKSQVKDKNAIGNLMVYESQNEIKYHEPDNYEQRIIALTSTITKEVMIDDKIPMIAVTSNIYDPKSFNGLLGPGAFSVYNFKLEEIDVDGDHNIYKIRIIPRKKSSLLVSGNLYVVDKTWSIRQAELEASMMGINIHFNMRYHEIKPGAFLISAYETSMDMNLMGIKGGGRFYASVKYNQLETNDNNYILTKADTVSRPDIIEQKPLTSKQQQDMQKIEELAAKENLTTREAYKMAQLIEKAVESDEIKLQKRSLEQLPTNSKIAVTRDSLALLRDSTFWNTTRTLPLHFEEHRSYLQYDSLKLVADSLRSADSLKNRTFGKWTTHLLLGEKINIGKNYYIRYDGLLFACPEYNFIDGFRIGQRIETGINFDKRHATANAPVGQVEVSTGQVETGTNINSLRSLSIAPAVYYTTARKEVDFIIDGALNYAPMRRGKFTVSAGNTIADFAGQNGSGRFTNTLSSIFVAANTAKYYQKKFVTVTNRIDIANGLLLTAGINYENRNDLENNTSYNFFNKQPASNRPHGQNIRMPDHKTYIAQVELEYTPRYYYRISNGRKNYIKSDFPTIRLSYDKGFTTLSRHSESSARLQNNNSSFDRIESSVYQYIRINLFNHLFYGINAGAFLSAKPAFLPDYKHFQTNELFLTGKSFGTSFKMENYRYATNDKWMQAHVFWSSKYLLLKQLPFLQRFLLDESLHLKTLWTPGLNHHEAGYSIGFGDLMQMGVFVCFRKQHYENAGIVLSIPIFNTVTNSKK